jgi:acyl-homoserine lactone acylase PvdQ
MTDHDDGRAAWATSRRNELQQLGGGGSRSQSGKPLVANDPHLG